MTIELERKASTLSMHSSQRLAVFDDEDDEELTAQQLRDKLRETLRALQEKDRDLLIAAEIGAHLVEVNKALVSKYESVDAQMQNIDDIVEDDDAAAEAERAASAKARARSAAVAAFSSSEVTADDDTMLRRPSDSLFVHIAALERSNADLRQELDTALANLRDVDAVHARTIKAMRETNEALQTQLRNALTEIRDESSAHTQIVSALENDIEYLRTELSGVAQTAAQLEKEKRRLLKEKVESLKESRHAENMEQELFAELQLRIHTLEADNDRFMSAKDEIEKRFMAMRNENALAQERIAELTAKLEESTVANQSSTVQNQVIEEMREQLEDMRSRFAALHDELERGREPSGARLDDEAWEWTPWLERAKNKAWERDIAGLRDEINDLRVHQQQAYTRLATELTSMVGRILEFTPTPISSITSTILDTTLGTTFVSALSGKSSNSKAVSDATKATTSSALKAIAPASAAAAAAEFK
eukprot:jgi/Hompol1/5079/HPOL_001301-RA